MEHAPSDLILLIQNLDKMALHSNTVVLNAYHTIVIPACF